MWDSVACKNLLENNEVFLSNYCSTKTLNVLEASGVLTNEEFIGNFRRVVKRLTELMPHASHNTTLWNWDNQAQARQILVTGNGSFDINNRFTISSSVIGLVNINQKIFIFKNANSDLCNDLVWIEQFETCNWAGLRNNKVVLPIPVDILNDDSLLESHPLHDNHPLSKALRSRNENLTNNHTSTIYPKLANGEKIPLLENITIPPLPTFTEPEMTLNTIIYGAPGTGKTYSTIEKALEIIDSKFLDEKRNNREELKSGFDAFVMKGQISFVTFHQSFSYEEFVEGIRAETTEDGKINYFVKSGIFTEISDKAKKAREKAKEEKGEEFKEEDVEKYVDNYVLIIDEINRGNISKIFGELITLIEESKRDGNDEALTITLPYSNKPFSVPNNLYIIGTMNTADRSLALMDTALRRRFDFVEMMPQPELLRGISVDGIDIEKMLTTMNKRITVLYDREHTLGHAFFMPLIKKPTIGKLTEIFKNKIIPLLQEYFFEDWEKIRKVLGDDKAKTKIPFIAKEDLKGLFEDEFDDESSILYTLNEKEKVLTNAASYINIYE
jgi:5-methylcytosine-specific restriction endonuclease McrBC GTP-binding regulatory subunit McrB